MRKLNGYVLPLTLMIIFASVGLLTTVMRRAFIFQDKVRYAFNREKARTLALAGIQVGMSQLSVVKPKENKKKENAQNTEQKTDKKEEKLTPEQEWLLQLMLVVNKWQTFNLTEKSDGIDARLDIYISCEQGKININSLLLEPSQTDKKQESAQAGQQDQSKAEPGKRKNFAESLQEKLVQEVGLSILEILKSKQKKLGRQLEDPTEILTEEAARKFVDRVFRTPEQAGEKADKFYLMDLFTVDTRSEKLNPWLLSASVCALLGLQVPQRLITEGKDKAIREAVKKLRPFIGWKKEWDVTMEPLYGKPFSAIPQGIDVLFAPEFEATVFSVISYVRVGNISQKVCGIIEKINDEHNTIFKLKKLYWM